MSGALDTPYSLHEHPHHPLIEIRRLAGNRLAEERDGREDVAGRHIGAGGFFRDPYSILNRSIEREVLAVTQQYGMGVLVWGPLGQGMLTGRVRRGHNNDVIRAKFLKSFSDDRRLEAVEQLIPLADEAGLSMPHLAMAFAIAHPSVTSALLGVRTMAQLDDLLAGMNVVLSDDILDQIDEIVPPGTDIGTLDQNYVPPAIQKTALRRRPLSERSAA